MRSERTANLLGAAAQLIVDSQIKAIETPTDLNPTEIAGLITILNEPGQQIDFLHKTLKRSHSATVRMVAKLVANNLIAKGVGEEDGRGVALSLTEQGRLVAANALNARRQALASLLAFLTEEEQATLDDLLAKLLAGAVVDELNAYQVCRFCDGETCDPCPVEEVFE